MSSPWLLSQIDFYDGLIFDLKKGALYKDKKLTEGHDIMGTGTMRDYSEKRDFIRMRVNAELTITREDNQNSTTGICRDLSGTGMLIEVAEAVPEGTRLFTSLPSQNESFPAFESQVTVVRCDPRDNGSFLLGVTIDEVKK